MKDTIMKNLLKRIFCSHQYGYEVFGRKHILHTENGVSNCVRNGCIVGKEIEIFCLKCGKRKEVTMKKKIIDWMFGDSMLMAWVKLLIPIILLVLVVIYLPEYLKPGSTITNQLANELTMG